MFNVSLQSRSAIEAHRTRQRVESALMQKKILYQRYSKPIQLTK